MAVSRRRAAAALAGLLAASAAALFASGPAGATSPSSSITVSDKTGDVMDLDGNATTAPALDISSVGATYKDGRITLSMLTGGADDLQASAAYWLLYTDPSSTTIQSDPDFVVMATNTDGLWSMLVNPTSDFFGNGICPTGTSMAYDAAKTSYVASFNASCIGSPASVRIRALRLGTAGGDDVPSTESGDPSLSDLVTAGTSHGYWMVGSDGKVYGFGDARKIGEPAASIAAPVVDFEPTPGGDGYWVVDEQGHVYAYNAKAFGNLDAAKLSTGEKVTSLSATPKGDGYWIFTSKGRVFPFGAAVSFGDMSGTALNGAVLDSIPTPSGQGYYMVGSDGGVFSFGDAKYAGSMGDKKLNAPVQSLVPDPDGKGYWLVASDGGI
ncbi:MAG TPA: hypothetical protein VGP90_04405, partial [Acidimicrobiia bacterium]|nr:hypothetical protein [Acidimicrobiia bacterium]